MLSQEQLERLRVFDAQGARVLSVYLDLDPGGQVRHTYRVAFEDLVKETRERLDDSVKPALAAEVERVGAWLESAQPGGQGLAVFSCSPRGLWQTEFFAVRLRNHLTFEPQPDVAPLLELADEYERYAVAVVDKGTARILSIFAGEIEEREEVESLVIGKHDQGGWSQANYQRHHEAHVFWHLKRVVQRLSGLLRRRRFDRLILMGPEEATSALRHLLPHVLAQRLAAVIPGTLAANDREIVDKTLEVERRIEREAEERLLDQVLDNAGPAGRATVGVTPTLAALWADLVQTLLVSHGLQMEGSECPNCARLDPGRVKSCPACGAAMRAVHDLLHRAMARAVDQAARVEVLHGGRTAAGGARRRAGRPPPLSVRRASGRRAITLLAGVRLSLGAVLDGAPRRGAPARYLPTTRVSRATT
jgi:peptide chain release factor subunit 1